MKEYIKKCGIPIAMEAVFIISCFMIRTEYVIYTNTLFYIALFVYFLFTGDLDLKEWAKSLKGGKKFWLQTVLTLLSFFAAFVATSALENIFSGLDDGMLKLKADTPFKLILFAISTILLPAVTEETFFRKNIISFENKGILAATAIFGMFLFAFEHAISPWGIILAMIWALPLTIAYVKTKNIYIPMTAHFIASVLANGSDIVFSLLR